MKKCVHSLICGCRSTETDVTRLKVGFQKLDDLETAMFLSQNQECPICFDDQPLEDFIAIIPCGHTFHRACLQKWKIQTMDSGPRFDCPMCGTFSGKNAIK